MAPTVGLDALERVDIDVEVLDWLMWWWYRYMGPRLWPLTAVKQEVGAGWVWCVTFGLCSCSAEWFNTHPSLSQVHPDPGLLGATTKHLFHKTDRGGEKERERVRDDNPGLFITAQTRRSDMNRSEHKCVRSRVVCHSKHYLEYL